MHGISNFAPTRLSHAIARPFDRLDAARRLDHAAAGIRVRPVPGIACGGAAANRTLVADRIERVRAIAPYRTRRGFMYRSASCFSILGS
jgi:hypothetical protein